MMLLQVTALHPIRAESQVTLTDLTSRWAPDCPRPARWSID
jgi:hypothetical protein